jgi:hypothetical protein
MLAMQTPPVSMSDLMSSLAGMMSPPPPFVTMPPSIEFLKLHNAAMKTRALTMVLQGQKNSSIAWAMTSAITDAAAPQQLAAAPAPMGSPQQLGDALVPALTAATITPVAALLLLTWRAGLSRAKSSCTSLVIFWEGLVRLM